MAIESIRAHTPRPYEIIVVDNGSRSETTDWLRTLNDPNVRVIFNQENRGFAEGNNQGFAAARGEFVVMLNNDVIVTSGWIDGLVDAFDRVPGLGVSAPRSNKVAGDQQLNDCTYNDIEAMHRYANERRVRLRGSGYLTDRAIGLCLCIDRRVLNEIGGIDPRFAVGNFEDDDFCMRVRAAGYKIYVCNDVFIHHFGSQSFAANKVDYAATMNANWRKFAQKWGYTGELGNGYQPKIAIAQGFDAQKHFVPLPVENVREYRLIFAASVENECDWNDVAAIVRKYARAFSAPDEVLFSIGAFGALTAGTIGERVQRLIEKAGIAPERAPDIEVSDEPDVEAWFQTLQAPHIVCAGGRAARADARLMPLSDRSPSGLQRLLDGLEISA
jgi:GT2 family glycosyltransferase